MRTIREMLHLPSANPLAPTGFLKGAVEAPTIHDLITDPAELNERSQVPMVVLEQVRMRSGFYDTRLRSTTEGEALTNLSDTLMALNGIFRARGTNQTKHYAQMAMDLHKT